MNEKRKEKKTVKNHGCIQNTKRHNDRFSGYKHHLFLYCYGFSIYSFYEEIYEGGYGGNGNECTHLVNHYHFYPFYILFCCCCWFLQIYGRLHCIQLLVLHQLFHFKWLVCAHILFFFFTVVGVLFVEIYGIMPIQYKCVLLFFLSLRYGI